MTRSLLDQGAIVGVQPWQRGIEGGLRRRRRDCIAVGEGGDAWLFFKGSRLVQ